MCLCLKASRVSEAERDVEHLLESNIGKLILSPKRLLYVSVFCVQVVCFSLLQLVLHCTLIVYGVIDWFVQ